MPRSLSITLVAVLQGIVSVASLVSGLFLLLLLTGRLQVYSQDLTTLPNALKTLVAIGLALSLFGIIVTYGLWQLKSWGWLGSLIFQALCIANNGLAILVGQRITANVYFAIALSLSLIGALCMPSVRSVFASSLTETDQQTS